MKTPDRLLLVIVVCLTAISSSALVRYVDVNGTNATPPFLDWSTAATNIQDAVDAADPGDQILVAIGVYRSGGRIVIENALATNNTTNRVAITKALTLQSVKGPSETFIEGFQVVGTTNGVSAVRCVYLTNTAVLAGFTLTNGATQFSTGMPDSPSSHGGGVHGGTYPFAARGVVSNCVLAGNSAYDSGGGAYNVTLNSCVLIANSANVGGGAANCTLNNCLLAGNSAFLRSGRFARKPWGGGAYASQLTNCLAFNNSSLAGGGAYGGNLASCTVVSNIASDSGGGVGASSSIINSIISFNAASNDLNYINVSNFSYSCTSPLPSGPGNLTGDPLFVNPAVGEFRLQTNSHCINAGNNAYVSVATDFDGNPRIVSRTVDIGAYEYQGIGSLISYDWLQQYGWPTDGSADALDPDGDGMNNWQEWRCLTDPTNAMSVLKLTAPTGGVSGLTVRWQSVPNRNYWLERATNFASSPAFSIVVSNLAGQLGTTTYTDTTATNDGPYFYRAGVQP